MWYNESFFKYSIGIILVLLIVLLLYHTSPFFSPILWFITAVFLPILFSTFLYYILRPIISLLERWLPRYIAILITYFVLIIGISTTGLIFIPEANETIGNISPEQIASLKTNFSHILARLKEYLPFSNLPVLENIIFSYMPKINALLYDLSINLITTLASIAVSIALTPFVLYYFLRDDNLLMRFILRFTPSQFQEEVQKIFQDIDNTLSEFILAQLTLAALIGVFLLCGYLFIGLPHALPLALFAMVFYVIPFLGTFIAIIPALIVGFSINFLMTLKVIGVMFLAHFLEANLITPRLMSNRLKIHPLTVILLLLAGGSLYGILGLLLVTPTYAILKAITWNLYKISRLRYAMTKNKVVHDEIPL